MQRLGLAWIIGGIIFFHCVNRGMAAGFDFVDFSDTTGLAINGDAAVAVTGDGTVLRLTESLNVQAGSAFFATPVSIVGFSTRFRFRITDSAGILDGGGQNGADGIAFAVQAQAATAIGLDGENMGYGGIPNAVAAEFDTFRNGVSSDDPSTNHVGITTGGTPVHGSGSPFTADIATRFDDEAIWFAWIDYDGTTIEVRANQSGIKPVAAVLSRDLDISALVGQGTAFVGLTSGTANARSRHEILSWSFQVVPEPPTVTLVISALLVCGMGRLRQSTRSWNRTRPISPWLSSARFVRRRN